MSDTEKLVWNMPPMAILNLGRNSKVVLRVVGEEQSPFACCEYLIGTVQLQNQAKILILDGGETVSPAGITKRGMVFVDNSGDYRYSVYRQISGYLVLEERDD